MYKIDRRHLDRFKISGAEISYISLDDSCYHVNLVDLKRGSVPFETKNNVAIGEIIELEMIFPKKLKL